MKKLRYLPLYAFYWLIPVLTCLNTGNFLEFECSNNIDFYIPLFLTPILLHIVWKIVQKTGVALNWWENNTGFISAVLGTLVWLFIMYIVFRFLPTIYIF